DQKQIKSKIKSDSLRIVVTVGCYGRSAKLCRYLCCDGGVSVTISRPDHRHRRQASSYRYSGGSYCAHEKGDPQVASFNCA
ncbi:hypothetical protein J1G36_23330, partial [Pseudomonas carnis]|uniref:hypothetical protein n=1 Tax=Pseudomonas carnis TaxID=2487355 RepID=UPI001CA65D31